MTINEIEKYIDLCYSDGGKYSVSTYKIDELEDIIIGVSLRVRYLLKNEPMAKDEILKCLNRFYNSDFGTFEHDTYSAHVPTYWQDSNAFGEYFIDCLDVPIYIHYEPNFMYDTVVYLLCENVSTLITY